MDICAEGTSCVERLAFNGPELDREAIENFRKKNSRSLRFITALKGKLRYRKVEQQLESLPGLTVLQDLRILSTKNNPGTTAQIN